MRGVASTEGSPYERISRYFKPILRTIQGRSGLFVKYSRELKEKVKGWIPHRIYWINGIGMWMTVNLNEI